MVNLNTDNSLSWTATIGTKSFEDDVMKIVRGFSKISTSSVQSSKIMEEAFEALKKKMQDAGKDTTELEKTYKAYYETQKKIVDLQKELSVMKTPDFLKGADAEKIETTNRFIDQQEKLLVDLNLVLEDYGKKLVEFANIEIPAPKIEAPEIIAPKSDNLSNVLGDQVVKKLKQDIGELDPVTEKFIKRMIELQIELQGLNNQQEQLDLAFNQSRISQDEYAEGTAFIVANIQRINDETELLTKTQQDYQNSLQQGSGYIVQKKEELEKLKQAYIDLNEEELKGQKGQDLSKQIIDLQLAIKKLDPQYVEKVRDRMAEAMKELRNLQSLMFSNPKSPLFEKWREQAGKLKEEIKAIKEGVDQATNSTAGLKAFTDAFKGILGAYTATVGIIGLATDNVEDYEKVTKNATSALAALNGVQEISNILSKTSALNIFLINALKRVGIGVTVAETAATQASTVANQGWLFSTEALAATQIKATATTRSLTAAMLANPAAVIVGAIVALSVAYLALRKGENLVRSETELLTEATKKAKDTYAEKMATLLPLVEAVKQQNLTERESIEIHEKLLEIDPGLIKNLDAKALSYETLLLNVNRYTDSLRAQYRLEVNKEATIESIKQEESLRKKIELNEKYIADQKAERAQSKSATGATSFGIQLALNKGKELQKALIDQQKVTESLVEKTSELSLEEANRQKAGENGVRRTVETINKEIAEIQKRIDKTAEDKETYAKGLAEIKILELERIKITGEVVKSKKGESEAQKEYNRLLEEQRRLLELIDNLKRDSFQSGLLKEQSEIDKINEKYDTAIAKIKEFNARAPKNLQIGLKDLENARSVEVQNQIYKNDAKAFKEMVELKATYFKDFEDFKAEYGENKAKELFKQQTEGSNSYLEYLKKQKAEIEGNVSIGPLPEMNIGELTKLQNLIKAIDNEEAKQRENAFNKQIEDYKKLIQATITYQEERSGINKKYDDLEKTLASDATLTDAAREEKKRILKQSREEELKAAADALTRESDLYRQLNVDIINYTRAQLKERLELLKKYLRDGKIVQKDGTVTTLTPQQKQDLKDGIEQAENFLKSTKEIFGLTVEQIEDVVSASREITGTIGGLATAIRPFNAELADTLDTMVGIANIAGDVATSFAQFASGDIVGGIGSALKAITGLFNLGAKSRAERKKREEERKQFYLNEFLGEIAINDLIRERLLMQTKLNTLKLDGLKAEKVALEANRKTLEEDYNRVFAEIQKLTYQAGYKQVFTAIGNRTAKDIQSLYGKTYEELERFYKEGKLDDKAKQLFEELQKLKQAGVDIEAQLEQNKRAAQEAFTGTTSDSILDSIVQGFADGKRATADFADDFEKLMQKAILNSLKYSALEKPLQKFYEDFAAAAESDGILTEDEIARLREFYNQTISAASQQFEELQNITNINFSPNGGNTNSLSGAVKGITQQQADLLAGQFSGLRLTAFEQLQELKNANDQLREINNNTRLLINLATDINYLKTIGIKVL